MKHIPNLLTLANAICGMMAIYFIVNSSSTGLVIALLSAATFDALDGWAARKVGASSALGKQLDSLADAISFGAVSGFIWSSILADYARMPQPWAMLIGAMVTASSIYRLGVFNLKEDGEKDFTGMPYDKEVWSQIVELGFAGILIPDEHGGTGFGPNH